MTAKKTPLPLRNDTILGVCEAIGQDFGFNPLWLRLAFIAPLFVAPMMTVMTYLGLGLAVAAVRYFAGDKTVDASTMTVVSTARDVTGESREDEMALAA